MDGDLDVKLIHSMFQCIGAKFHHGDICDIWFDGLFLSVFGVFYRER